MANIYLCGKYQRHEEFQQYAKQLEAKGHAVTSRWIRGDHDAGDMDKLNDPENFALAQRFAKEDYRDLMSASLLISFNESSRSPGRGGRHVELGIALAWGLRIILVGPRENVFHCLSNCERYDTWEEALENL